MTSAGTEGRGDQNLYTRDPTTKHYEELVVVVKEKKKRERKKEIGVWVSRDEYEKKNKNNEG